MKIPPHRFVVLDAWRGVAAVLVVLFHCTGELGGQSHLYFIPFVQNSWLMVDFFFVLSGFVISHAALGKLHDGKDAGTFLIRRFGRIWPLHVAVLTIFVMIALAKAATSRGAVPAFGPHNSLVSVFENLLLIQGLDVQKWDMWNAPAWSISVEFYTYFIFLGVCLLSAHKRFSTIGPALILIAGSIIILARGDGMWATFDLGIFRCVYGFFVGHLTYLLWRRHKNRSPALEWLAIGLAIVVVSFGAIVPVQFCAPLAFAFAVWVFAEQVGPISRLGKTTFMQWLGAWSYSIYMIHWLGLYMISRLFPILDARLGTHMVVKARDTNVAMPVLAIHDLWIGDVASLAFAGLIIAASSMTYRWIEQPARRYFNTLASAKGVRVSRSSSVV